MNLSLKNRIALLIGNALEYYDFMLFGFFATLLAPLFFPHDNATVSLIASMGSYGVGFLARPIGGIVLGHLGDRWGRKNALSLSILLLMLPTLAIGLLPTYDSIGIWAPLLLVFCRFLQGFCLGGESSGAMTYLIENTSPPQRDVMSAWLVTSCYGGTLVGTLLGSFFMMPFMPSWGWRLTFIVGSLIAFVGYYLRKRLKESPEFLTVQKKGKILKFPLKSLFINEKKHLMYAALLASPVIVPFFIIFIYLNGFFVRELLLAPSFVLILNSGLMGFWILCLPLFGLLCQRYGRNLIMTGGLLGMALFCYPLFLMMGTHPTLENILFVQVSLSIFATAYAAPVSAFLVSLFPVNQRYSGISVGYSLGHAIIGGFTPILLTISAQSLGFSKAPALFILVSCFLGASVIFQTPFLFSRSLQGIFKIKASTQDNPHSQVP